MLQVNPKLRPNCDQKLDHPIIQKRIGYFDSLSKDNNNKNKPSNKALLKTIHMPKNIIFLSDKLPKPNYEKTVKNNEKVELNPQNYRNYLNEEDRIIKMNKYNSIPNSSRNPGFNYNDNALSNKIIPEEKTNTVINNNNNNTPNKIITEEKSNALAIDKKEGLIPNKNKIIIMPPLIGNNVRQNHHLNLPSIGSSDRLISKNRRNYQKELVSLDIIAKQKNELSKLMLNNNSLNRKLNYLNNKGYLNPIQMKDIYKIYPYINRSLPQKGINSNRMKQKYLNPSYAIRNERYNGNGSQKKFDYDYNYNYNNLKNNKLIIKNNIKVVEKEGPEIKVAPKKKLNPIKKPNIVNLNSN